MGRVVRSNGGDDSDCEGSCIYVKDVSELMYVCVVSSDTNSPHFGPLVIYTPQRPQRPRRVDSGYADGHADTGQAKVETMDNVDSGQAKVETMDNVDSDEWDADEFELRDKKGRYVDKNTPYRPRAGSTVIPEGVVGYRTYRVLFKLCLTMLCNRSIRTTQVQGAKE